LAPEGAVRSMLVVPVEHDDQFGAHCFMPRGNHDVLQRLLDRAHGSFQSMTFSGVAPLWNLKTLSPSTGLVFRSSSGTSHHEPFRLRATRRWIKASKFSIETCTLSPARAFAMSSSSLICSFHAAVLVFQSSSLALTAAFGCRHLGQCRSQSLVTRLSP